MNDTNLIELRDFREQREQRKSQETYKRYLETLGNSQLEAEINFLLDEFSKDSYGQDFFLKVRMVQQELVSRADIEWKHKIELINNETLSPLV